MMVPQETLRIYRGLMCVGKMKRESETTKAPEEKEEEDEEKRRKKSNEKLIW